MAIKIASNIDALSTVSQLGKSSSAIASAIQRLSSGLRINSASDDAAGLAIASTLHANARLYAQAVRNLNDGISTLSIAQGALETLSSIVTRQQELAEQSANGSYSDKQRTAIDTEASALRDEYNRIISTTSFNGVSLLNGGAKNLVIQAGINSQSSLTVSIGTQLQEYVNAQSLSIGGNPQTVGFDFSNAQGTDQSYEYSQFAIAGGSGSGSGGAKEISTLTVPKSISTDDDNALNGTYFSFDDANGEHYFYFDLNGSNASSAPNDGTDVIDVVYSSGTGLDDLATDIENAYQGKFGASAGATINDTDNGDGTETLTFTDTQAGDRSNIAATNTTADDTVTGNPIFNFTTTQVGKSAGSDQVSQIVIDSGAPSGPSLQGTYLSFEDANGKHDFYFEADNDESGGPPADGADVIDVIFDSGSSNGLNCISLAEDIETAYDNYNSLHGTGGTLAVTSGGSVYTLTFTDAQGGARDDIGSDGNTTGLQSDGTPIFKVSTPAPGGNSNPNITGIESGDYAYITSNGYTSTGNGYFWYNVDGTGVDPNLNAGNPGNADIEVDINSTDSATTVAQKTVDAINNSHTDIGANLVSSGGSVFDVSARLTYGGESTSSDIHGGSAITNYGTSNQLGVNSGDYLTVTDGNGNNDYFWFNVDHTGTDPLAGNPAYAHGVEVDLSTQSNAPGYIQNQLYAAANSAGLDLRVLESGNLVTFQNNELGPDTAPTSSNSNISASVTVPGQTAGENFGASSFTIPSNGFNTGDLITFKASGTTPGGLTSGNTYYAIKLDNNTFKLATTLANANNGIGITLTSVGSGELTFSTATNYESSFSLATATQAQSAITTLANALTNITNELGNIGASQSRLSIAVANAQNLDINSQRAEGSIMDDDVAADSAQLLREQILQQADVSVLAQVNQEPALAIKLLQ